MHTELGDLHWVVVVVAAMGLASGCSDGDDAGGSEGGPTGSCGAFGEGEAAAVTATSPVSLDSTDGTAQNTLDHDRNAQLAPATLGAVAVGPCGDSGVLLRDVDEGLLFIDLSAPGTAEVVEPSAGGGHDSSLLFDGGCSPIVLRVDPSLGYVEYTRGSDGSWSPSEALADLGSVLGEGASVSHRHAGRRVDGSLFVIGSATVGSSERLLVGTRDGAAGSAWTFVSALAPNVTDLQDVAVGGDGTLHATYRNSEFPCDPCNVDFYYASLTAGGSSWTQEVVQQGAWGNPHDELVESSSLALTAEGAPIIAAHFVTRVVTGSYRSCELRIYVKSEDGWCNEAVASSNDGFAGSDGAGYTGAAPQLEIDTSGRLHVLFRDQSVWHDGTGQNEMRGQLRHALRAGTDWTVTTLLSQQGQTESANPVLGVVAPGLAISPEGAELVAVGVVTTWQTASIYNNDSVPATYEAQAVTATVD